jgi:hypothetical protein
MKIYTYHSEDAPEHLSWLARIYHGFDNLVFHPVIFHAASEEAAYVKAQIFWDTEIEKQEKAKDARIKREQGLTAYREAKKAEPSKVVEVSLPKSSPPVPSVAPKPPPFGVPGNSKTPIAPPSTLKPPSPGGLKPPSGLAIPKKL